MGKNHIVYELMGHKAILTLTRPEVLNALNKEMVEELDEKVEELRRNKEVRVVIITGAEGNFVAGADIAAMINMVPEEARAFSFKDTFNKIADLPQPVIAAVDGYALGAGCELALTADICLATGRAKFGLPEITLGIIPGAGGSQRLPRLIGMPRAKELILTGNMIDAHKACEYGLINRVVNEEQLLEEAFKLADKIASRPPIAVNIAKHVINHGAGMETKTAIEMEAIAWANLFSSQDQKEGMQAFLEKRKPQFAGK